MSEPDAAAMTTELPDICSVGDLLTEIRKSGHPIERHAHLRLWMRGHSQMGWKLEPRVYRPSFGDFADENERLLKEQHLTQDFRVFSASLRTGSMTDEEMYFLQQHYLMPTRLLDWTTDPLAAMYFVTREDLDTDGELVLMDPYMLAVTQNATSYFKGIATSRNQYFIASVQVISNWRGSADSLFSYILPVRPDHFDQRIVRQRGYFTFHVPKGPTLTPANNSTLRRFRVPGAHKAFIRTELSLLGVNDFTVFGDLDHLATWLTGAHA